MPTVWILGAGASKAAYCGMPLVKDFMELALQRLRFPRSPAERLLTYIRNTYGYERLQDVNVEELLTFAWLDNQSASVRRDSESSGPLYHALDTLRTVEAIIVAMLFQAQHECICRGDQVHDSLARRVDKTQDTVINFNYDLLFDDALWRANRASLDDYGVQFSGSVDGAPGPADRQECLRDPKIQPGTPVLKLHGSLNWLGRAYLSRHDPFRPDSEVFYLRNARDVSKGPEFWWTALGSLPTEDNRDFSQSRDLRPIIVPPAFAKDAWRESPMGNLWPKAQKALQGCDRVVIIGLSLREADYRTRWLLRTALTSGRPRDVEIAIVNKGGDDRNRLRGFFLDLGKVVLYESVDEFLDGLTVE